MGLFLLFVDFPGAVNTELDTPRHDLCAAAAMFHVINALTRESQYVILEAIQAYRVEKAEGRYWLR